MYLERVQRALPEVRERIARACRRAGRSDPDSVTLVAVTKGHPAEALHAARDAGLQVIGENRVQEARAKWRLAGDLGLTWHMVGHLQRNKVHQALQIFELIHSVDSLRLAETIDKEAAKSGRPAQVLVQVNASGEESKYGFPVGEGLEAVRRVCGLPNLRVMGLMTMAPLTNDEGIVRAAFRRTRELFDLCRDGVERFEARDLSMGMSSDYEIAVEEGSTMVRLGTVLFGEREND
jgi:pyridoxal phosphate enzyme (YggS family)